MVGIAYDTPWHISLHKRARMMVARNLAKAFANAYTCDREAKEICR
jgi:hypothetical protein